MPRRAERPVRDRSVLLEEGERRSGVGVEVHDGRLLGVALPAHLALVVEPENGPGRLDAVVDLRHGDDEAVAGEPHGPAQSRLGELEDVGVEDDAGVRAAPSRRGEERPHLPSVHRDLDVLACEDHPRILSHGSSASLARWPTTSSFSAPPASPAG